MTLIETVSGMLSPRLLAQLAGKFGIPSSTVGNSVSGIAGTLVDGLAGDASNSRTMDSVAHLINESPDEVEDLDRMVDDENSPMRRRGSQLLGFASKDPSGLANKIGSLMGLRPGIASSLLGTVAALVMGGFRRFGRHTHVDGASLGSLLRNERSSFQNLIPASFRTPTAVQTARPAYGAAPVVVAHKRALWPLALIPLALLGIWLLARNRHEKPEVSEVRMPTSGERVTVEARETPLPQQRATAKVTAPPESATPEADTPEARLSTELRAPAGATAQWVDLDQVKFDLGSAQLDPSSDPQVARVAQVLTASPDAKVHLAGYADATGTAAINDALSRKRAESVKQALVARGIDASRIEVTALGTTQEAEAEGGPSKEHRGVAIRVAH